MAPPVWIPRAADATLRLMQKIVTLTLNPALDISASVDSVAAEIKLRCGPARMHPGGGGINVSRAIHFLGGSSTAVYAAGGHTGAMLASLLEAESIVAHRAPIAGTTRENFVVYESSTTLQYRFNLPGPELSAEECSACLDAVFAQDPAWIVVSGSLPAGVPLQIYGEIARTAQERGVKVIVDASGKALRHALDAGVFLLKPNLRELENFAGAKLDDENAIKSAARTLIADGLTQVLVVSLGAAGAALITADAFQRIPAPIVKPRSKVGAGDSMVAGLTLALAQGRDLVDSLRFGIAAGSAAVMTPGTRLCRREDAERLYRQIASQGAGAAK